MSSVLFAAKRPTMGRAPRPLIRILWPLTAAVWFAPALHAQPQAASAVASRDAVAIRALFASAEDLELRDPGQARALVERAARQADDARLPALGREARARICLLTTDDDAVAALSLADAGVKAATQASDPVNLARDLECRGYALDNLGRRDEAAMAHENAVAAAERAGAPVVLADTLAGRGENRYFFGRYDEAIADLDRAYALHTRAGRASGQQYVLNAIANVYVDDNVGEYDKAIGYYRQLLRQSEAEGEKSEIATARFNIGSAQERKGAFAAAQIEYRRALEIDTALGNDSGIADGERALCNVLVELGKPAEALPLIESAMSRYRAADDAENIARSRIVRARALRAQGRMRDALADLDDAERYFSSSKNPRYLSKIHEQQADIHALNGEWKAAYAALKAYRVAKEELENRARKEQGNRLRVQFDTAKKEQENHELKIENAHRGEALRGVERVRSLQRLVILLGTAFLALLGAMALQQVHKSRRLRLLAMTDELTGLANRRSILECLAGALSASRESGTPLSLIAFDIDHFKRINDAYGHHGGDRALRFVAERVAARLPEKARVGRMGGEEFLVVLPSLGIDAAMTAAERLRMAVSSLTLEGVCDEMRITISLGVSEAGEDDDVQSLLKRADVALYRAKDAGRDCAVRG